MIPQPPLSTLFPTRRSSDLLRRASERALQRGMRTQPCLDVLARTRELLPETPLVPMTYAAILEAYGYERFAEDRKSTRLNSSHVEISYAVFCLKKKSK